MFSDVLMQFRPVKVFLSVFGCSYKFLDGFGRFQTLGLILEATKETGTVGDRYLQAPLHSTMPLRIVVPSH